MDEIKNDANEATQPKESVALQIIITLDGSIKLSGPILGDRMAAYGILEIAKDMVHEMHSPKIVQPGGMMKFLRNGHK